MLLMGEEATYLISDCSVTVLEPHYTFTVLHPDPRDLLEFTIIPRNNVEGARNRTPSEHSEAYFYGMIVIRQ